MTTPVNGTGQEPAANGPEGQAPAGQQGQQPTGGQAPQGQQGGAQDFDLNQIQDPALRGYLERVQKDAQDARQEAARYRTERNTLQQAAEQARQATLTDAQRAQEAQQQREQEFQRLQQENRDLKVGSVVREAATKAQAFDGGTVWALIKDAVQVDDQGNPTNVDALITGLKQSHQYLFRRVSGDAGAGTGPAGAPGVSMNDEIRRLAGRG